ncbi:hypothetical protein BK667_18030 [Pseudomonas frederiksbergensis]|nr:hypothetical protein BK667_18030 [Pseudomonas frederiksbergensis]
MPRNPNQLLDHLRSIFKRGRLNHRQIKTVIGKSSQGLAVFDKLDQERGGTAGATWPAIEITQKRWLMFSAKQDFWIALGEVCRDRRGTYNGA